MDGHSRNAWSNVIKPRTSQATVLIMLTQRYPVIWVPIPPRIITVVPKTRPSGVGAKRPAGMMSGVTGLSPWAKGKDRPKADPKVVVRREKEKGSSTATVITVANGATKPPIVECLSGLTQAKGKEKGDKGVVKEKANTGKALMKWIGTIGAKTTSIPTAILLWMLSRVREPSADSVTTVGNTAIWPEIVPRKEKDRAVKGR